VKLGLRRRVVAPERVHVSRDVRQLLRVVDSAIDRKGGNELREPAELLAARFRKAGFEVFQVPVVGKL